MNEDEVKLPNTGITLLDHWLWYLLWVDWDMKWPVCQDAADILAIQERYPELIPALAAAKDSDLKDANVRTALRKTVAELIELGDDEIDIYEEV